MEANYKNRTILNILKFDKKECVFLCMDRKGKKIKVDLIEDETLEKQIDISTKAKCKKLEHQVVKVQNLNLEKESCTNVVLAKQMEFFEETV